MTSPEQTGHRCNDADREALIAPFDEKIQLWSRDIALAPLEVFRACCAEGASFVRKGVDRSRIADELIERADRQIWLMLGGTSGRRGGHRRGLPIS